MKVSELRARLEELEKLGMGDRLVVIMARDYDNNTVLVEASSLGGIFLQKIPNRYQGGRQQYLGDPSYEIPGVIIQQ